MEKKLNEKIVVIAAGFGVLWIALILIFAETTAEYFWIWGFLLSFIFIGMNLARFIFKINLSIFTSVLGIWFFASSFIAALKIEQPGVIMGLMLLPIAILILVAPDKWTKHSNKTDKPKAE